MRSAWSRVRGVSTSTTASVLRRGSKLKALQPAGYRRRMDLARRLAVARGDEPADLVVRGGRVLSVFTREWLETDLAIAEGYVAGLGNYDATEEIDAIGRYVVPGFIDAHMHLE